MLTPVHCARQWDRWGENVGQILVALCKTPPMAKRPENAAALGDLVALRLRRIAERATTLTRGVELFALAAGALAFAVGLFVFPPSWRITWVIWGIGACALPAIIALFADLRLRRVLRTVPETARELRTIHKDSQIRKAMIDLADRDDDHEARTPLIKLGSELNSLRRAISSQREQVINTWRNVTALTSLPAMVALAVVGMFALLALSAIAVAARVALLGTG